MFLILLSTYQQCAAAGNAAMLEFLVENGADCHITDRNGQTPLHLAAMYDRVACVETLLSHGADADTPDTSGRTAAGLARGKECAALLPQPDASEPMLEASSYKPAPAASLSAPVSGGGAGKAPPGVPPPPPPPVDSPGGSTKCTALFKFSSQRADELSFQKGDSALILRKGSSGWWEAIINGERGLVPGNYFKMDTHRQASDDDDSDET